MSLRSRIQLLFALLLAASTGVHANFETRPADLYSIENGLSQNSVWALAMDGQGFLWIGTEDGLNRFDGQSFQVFRRDEDSSHSLAENFVTAILADGDALVVGTRAGSLQRFDLRQESFQSLPEPVASALRGNSIDDLLRIGPGQFLIGTRDRGLFSISFDDTGATLKRQWNAESNGLPSNKIRSLHQTSDGGVWVGTDKGLCLLQDFGDRCTQPDWPALRQIAGADVGAILNDARGNLWVAAMPTGLLRIRSDGKTYDLFERDNSSLPAQRVETLLMDAQGRVWAGTDAGVVRFDESCRCFITPRALGRSTDHTKQLAVSMLEDPTGGLWIGYFNLGLERIALDANGIRHYKPSTFAEVARSADRIRAILPTGLDRYILGTFGDGVYELETDPDRGLIQSLKRLFPIDKLKEGQKQVWGLAQVDSILFIGTDAGLMRYDSATSEMTELKLGGKTQIVRQLLYDSKRQSLWVGSEHGLCRYRVQDENTICLDAEPTTPGHLSNRFVFALHLDQQDRLWAGTWNGLDRIDPELVRAEPVPAEETGIANALIYDIAESRDGQLWIGSNDGLVRFTPGRKPEILRERQGLTNRVIYGIEHDRDQALWLSSVRGVMRFDPRSRVVTTYDQRDGLQGNEFLFGAHAQDDAGRILFAGINGMNRIEPERVVRTLKPPSVHLTQLSVLGKPLSVANRDPSLPKLDSAPTFVEHITLGTRHNMLELEFAAPDFDQPKLLRFEYQLKGFDEQWIELGARRFVSFTNLAPGMYQLSIRARNRFGEASLRPASLAIEVTPPIHATWWFRTIAVLISLGLIWGVFYWRTQDLRRQRVRLEREVVRRTDEVRSQNRKLAEQRAELERANQELFQLSNRDPLTGAYNRRYIQERLARAVANGSATAIAILDIDWFKRINDRYGHLAGDDCLRHTVACMSEVLGDQAEFARWGGEEFLMLFEQKPAAQVGELLETLRKRIASKPAFADKQDVELTVSIGWFSTSTDRIVPLAEQVRQADEALYRAKNEGRNRVAGA
ncbi:MAG: diguanylate cyclase [Ahniella sp.]|nr:diguanylate cyclase [Ahniella sp.]